ncbi:hypothetical protein OA92_21200 [Marinomonas sp. SBI22]|uniref:hypothetical protein n=1 Tax=unclassified Marinomonas TaxID=196814 RepID=UPI0007AF8760|nr:MULTISPECIES: hypothetical protein [unclassified Marinomonas]KZM39115.1 hypothetical protein OA92_21200 [Marinomonas sp. SBI22]KZM39899.1 hypothetical protein OA91_21055 [Marinomonas sp. SBI8L]
MNKALFATLLSSSVFIAGCNESIDSTDSSDVASPIVSFAPLATTAVLSTPNDLLLDTNSASSTFGRLNNITGQNTADVYAATAQLDGWGLGTPFTIQIELPDSAIHQTTLDSASVKQAGAVYIFKCKSATSVILGTCDDSLTDITQLTYGTDYSLSTSDDGIVVTPLKPFEANTGYFLGVSALVKDSFGQTVTRSSTFNTYSEGTGAASATEISLNTLLAGTNTLIAGFTTLNASDVMYSATWTTQDVESTAQAVMDKIVTDAGTITGLTNTGFTVRDILAANYGTTFDDASQAAFITQNTLYYKGTLDIPYYLPYPGYPTINTSLTCSFSTLCGNWKNASGQSPWKGSTAFATPVETVDNTSAAYDATTAALSPNSISVQLLVPNTTLMNALNLTEVKVAQYIHGITAVKENAFLLSPSMAAVGFALISIDHPLHGSRSLDTTGDGVYEFTATSTSYGAKYANGNSAVFANLSSLLTARDNLRQAASDQLALRWAISNTDLTSTNAAINTSEVSLVGISLGSMIGTVAQAMSEIRDDADNAFNFSASALTVGGTQVGPIMGYSKSFGPIVKEALVSTTSFSGGVAEALGYTTNEALILQAASGDTYGSAAQTAIGMTAAQAQASLGATEAQASAEFKAMIDLGYPGFLSAFINGAQVVVDSGDALIWSTKTTTTPTLATQVIGNGSTNLSDQTVPNDVISDGFPIAGTLGWLNTLNLTKQSTSTTGTGLRLYTNFLVGKHTSAVDPNHEAGVTESATAAAAATTEMQAEIASFLSSKGATLTISDATGTVIE